MKNVDNLVAAMDLVQDFFIDGKAADLPDDIKAKLRETILPGAITYNSCRTALEAIYARRDELPVELLQIGVQITNVMVATQQAGYQNGRGQGIVAALVEMPGVMPTVATDSPEPPKPDKQFSADVLNANPGTPTTSEAPPAPVGPKAIPPSPTA